MKLLFITFFTLFFSLSNCNAQEINCKSFRIGTFKNVVDGKPTGTIIKRDENFQIEINEERGLETKDKVTWIDECTYRLSSVHDKSNSPNLIVRITETGEDYYLLTLWMESDPSKILKTKMVRIE